MMSFFLKIITILKVLIIDNGSSDGGASYIEGKYFQYVSNVCVLRQHR